MISKILYIFIILALFQTKGAFADRPGAVNDKIADFVGTNCSRPTPSEFITPACADAMVNQCLEIAACEKDSDPQGCADNVGSKSSPACNASSAAAPTSVKKDGAKFDVSAEPPASRADKIVPKDPSKPKTDSAKDPAKPDDTTTTADTTNAANDNACRQAVSDGQDDCDTSQASTFSSQVGQKNTGSIGVMNGSQQISNVVSNCQSRVDDCNAACSKSGVSSSAKSGCNRLANNLDTLNTAGNKAMREASNNPNNQSPTNNNPSNDPNSQNPSAMSPSSAAQKDCNNPVNNCSQQQTASGVTTGSDSGTNAGMVGQTMAHGIANASGMNVGGDAAGNKQSVHFQDPNANQPGAGMAGINPMMGGGQSGSGFGANNQQNANANVGGGGRGGFQVASSNKADILKGERAGTGGYTGARGIASVDNPRRGGRGGGLGGMNFGAGVDEFGRMRGLDLKAYLPGGRQDPTRRLGGANGLRPDLHAAHENLFNIVSTRFQVHCKFQLLYDCR